MAFQINKKLNTVLFFNAGVGLIFASLRSGMSQNWGGTKGGSIIDIAFLVGQVDDLLQINEALN